MERDISVISRFDKKLFCAEGRPVKFLLARAMLVAAVKRHFSAMISDKAFERFKEV